MEQKKSNKTAVTIGLALLLGIVAAVILFRSPESKQAEEVDETPGVTMNDLGRIYELSDKPNSPGNLYVATKGGLISAGLDGVVRPVSSIDAEFFSFAIPAGQPKRILAGGADKSGKGLGLMISDDSGVTWQEPRGESVFLDLEISRSAPGQLYGLTDKGVMVSTDEGKSWSHLVSLPDRVFDMALSPSQDKTVYIAGMKGLMVSRGGSNWEEVYKTDSPATSVHVEADGHIYAFIVGVGVVKAQEPDFSWTTLSSEFQDRAFMRLARSTTDPKALYAISDTSLVFFSRDDGVSWESFEGSRNNTPQSLEAGKRIYQKSCQNCHGVNGTGESAENIAGTDLSPAPALDDSAHAWHHSNQDLIKTILEGSSQEGSRMKGWKDTLSKADAKNVLTYIKSLWSFRSVACQGSRHMACMQH